jgi:large subunit ribosomal protein L4
MKVAIKDIQGNSAGEHDVKFAVITDNKGQQAVHDHVVAIRAGARRGTACAKTVGEVAGSNKKPWRQKGTGRARAGSVRSPLWRGGGVVHGPRPRDFSKKVNKKVKHLALRRALSERLSAGDVIVVSELKLTTPKTKDFIALLKTLGLDRTSLFVDVAPEKNVTLASRNIQGVRVVTGLNVNTYDVLKYDKLVFTKAAFEQVEARLNKQSQPQAA